MKFLLILLYSLITMVLYSQTENHKLNTQTGIDSFLNSPPIDRVWTASEFQGFLRNLITKQADSSFKSPTIADNKKLFLKITTFENYEYLIQKDNSLNDRFSNIINTLGLAQTVLINYYNKSKLVNGKLSYEGEITRLHNFLLKLTMLEAEFADEFLKSNPDLNQAQKEGQQKMITGFSIVVMGDLNILKNDYSKFSVASICSICTSFKEFYLFMHNRFDKVTRTKFDTEIEILKRTHNLECVRKSLEL